MEELVQKIKTLKNQKNAIILSHFYQSEEIQNIADFIGDSLALSYEAKRSEAEIIVFAGVYFMGETAKILAPDKKILIPDLEAGCSLADNCPPDKFTEFIKNYPDHTVISYINCNAAVKSLSDVICTSSNALKIIESFDPDEKIIFAPDKNLGKYLEMKTGRDMILWDGSCLIHEDFSEKKILELKQQHPEAKIIAHPECAPVVIMIADFIGSTNALINYAKQDSGTEYIVVTEAGILTEMRKTMPHKNFISAPLTYYTNCNCGECPFMKLNTLEKIYNCLLNEDPEVLLDEDLRISALHPLERMFQLTEM